MKLEKVADWTCRTQRPDGRGNEMMDGLNFAMLICASVGSMAFGVLTAYGIFRVAFAMMRPKQRTVVVKTQAEVAL